ncbi:MAG: hypothetical protein MUC41_12955, partial [Syntrophobacteraceae bacterium]|nr:hypothetical protein [Syntrophobacteraceae bacterium]
MAFRVCAADAIEISPRAFVNEQASRNIDADDGPFNPVFAWYKEFSYPLGYQTSSDLKSDPLVALFEGFSTTFHDVTYGIP